MHNFYAKYIKILDICKKFSKNLVNELGNVPRRGVVPKFSDLEVIALSLTAESLSMDSENCLFVRLNHHRDLFPNLISRRQFNTRRKLTVPVCNAIRERMADEMDGGESFFCIDSKPVEVCRIARSSRCRLGKSDYETASSFGFCASQNTQASLCLIETSPSSRQACLPESSVRSRPSPHCNMSTISREDPLAMSNML